ncbi:MAG: sugar phosphate isomerase/epimerase [Rhodospirillales bacterium]|nr:sugar phosphate isomerase/epimerase [Rhodospirillales bacterium]
MEAAVPPFGWCGTLDEAPLMHEAGLDHVELQIVPMRIADPVAFAKARARIADLPLPSLAMSYLFPHDMRLVGPDADERRIRAYFERVVVLLAQAKARVVVLGSGWSRDVPDGWTQGRTEEALLRALGWCADALAGSGAVLAIEPLNRNESNLVNRLADAVRLARALGRPEVRAMADFYHMAVEGEPPAALREHGEWLAHVQVSDTGRHNPGTGTQDFHALFGHLKAAGYRGALTAECVARGELLAAMRDSHEFVRRAWRAA